MTETVLEAAEDGQVLSELSDLEAILPADCPLLKYVQWACGTYGSPPLFHLAGVLVFMLHELTRRGFYLQSATDGSRYPLTLWFALVGISGTGKSSAINIAQDFSRTMWEVTAQDISPDPWLEPEGSIQGVFAALQDYYDRSRDTTAAILYHHELAQVFATREAISEQLCKFADGRTIQANYRQHQKRRRTDQRTDRVVNPRLSLLAATTEAQLAPHFKDAQRSGGVFTRFIWLHPQFKHEHIRLRLDHAGAVEQKKQRELTVHAFAGWCVTLSQMQTECGFDFEFTEAAHQTLEHELFASYRAAQVFTDDNMHGVRTRLIEKARVLAVAFASMRGSLDVEPQDVLPAVGLVRIFFYHIATISGLGSSDLYRLAEKIEAFVKGFGDNGVLRKDLYRHMRIEKRTLDVVLETLSDKGTVFVNWHDRWRPGVLVHVSTDAGRALDLDHRKRETLAAEIAAAEKQSRNN